MKTIALYIITSTEKAYLFSTVQLKDRNKMDARKIWLPRARAKIVKDYDYVPGLEWKKCDVEMDDALAATHRLNHLENLAR